MTSHLSRQGSPRPYVLQSVRRGESFSQVALVECRSCREAATIPWTSAENPSLIVKRFQREGWTFYTNSKCSCPSCSNARRSEKGQDAMNGSPSPIVNRLPATAPATSAAPQRSFYIVTVDGSELTLTRIEGAQEMLFGDRSYLCIPSEALT